MTKKTTSEIPEEIKQQLKTIGQKVKLKRKAVEKNYQVFAKKKGINAMTLSRIERGNNSSLVSFIEVLNALEIKFEDFFKNMQ